MVAKNSKFFRTSFVYIAYLPEKISEQSEHGKIGLTSLMCVGRAWGRAWAFWARMWALDGRGRHGRARPQRARHGRARHGRGRHMRARHGRGRHLRARQGRGRHLRARHGRARCHGHIFPKCVYLWLYAPITPSLSHLYFA